MAMDNSNSGLFGLFGQGFGSSSPINVPVNHSSVSPQLSPYLSVDPKYLQNQPEFITLEGAKPKRGRFELAFSQIGGMVLVGSSIGIAQGLYKGRQEINKQGLTGKIRNTQLLNYTTKRIAGSANALGTIAVLYASLGCLLYWARGSREDFANTLAAGALTGALYQSAGGLRRAGVGGAVGLALAGIYVAATSRPSEYSSRY